MKLVDDTTLFVSTKKCLWLQTNKRIQTQGLEQSEWSICGFVCPTSMRLIMRHHLRESCSCEFTTTRLAICCDLDSDVCASFKFNFIFLMFGMSLMFARSKFATSHFLLSWLLFVDRKCHCCCCCLLCLSNNNLSRKQLVRKRRLVVASVVVLVDFDTCEAWYQPWVWFNKLNKWRSWHKWRRDFWSLVHLQAPLSLQVKVFLRSVL